MIKRPPGEWIDARNADNRRLDRPCRRVHKRPAETLRLYHFPLAMNPFGLYVVQPRALLWQKAAYDPHSLATLFDLVVMFAEPAPHLAAYVPACVVPDEKQDLLADRFELLGAPSEKPARYAAHGPTIHEPQPRLVELR